MVVKGHGGREPFDRAKIIAGVTAASKGRPVTARPGARRWPIGSRTMPGCTARRCRRPSSAWPCSRSCAASTRSPTCASPASTRTSTRRRRLPARAGAAGEAAERLTLPWSVRAGGAHHRVNRKPSSSSTCTRSIRRDSADAWVVSRGPSPPASCGDRVRLSSSITSASSSAPLSPGLPRRGRTATSSCPSAAGEVELADPGAHRVDRRRRGVLGEDQEAGAAGEQGHRRVQIATVRDHADPLTWPSSAVRSARRVPCRRRR